MQIVIDIDEDLYEGIERRDGALETEYVCDELMKAVDTGISLPKGHGRLIDAGVLSKDCESSEYHEVITSWLDLAPTIIEADKESEE